MKPITKQESRHRNDRQASVSIYRHRPRIDDKLRELKLQRELKEVWSQ